MDKIAAQAPDASSAGAVKETSIVQVTEGMARNRADFLVVEEPLEIMLGYGPVGQRQNLSLAVTMRTPGEEEALAVGFLFTEGVIARAEQLVQVRRLAPNKIRLTLRADVAVETARLKRNLFAASGCGICGKASLDAVQIQPYYFPQMAHPKIDFNTLRQLPGRLRAAQAAFNQTGGLHAAALFDPAGNLRYHCEDIGRHNAVDKVIGAALLDHHPPPFREWILLVSGRAGFELVQKAAMAGLPMLAAVGAPSSLAVETAETSGMTLVGFLREERCNVYAHPNRVIC